MKQNKEEFLEQEELEFKIKALEKFTLENKGEKVKALIDNISIADSIVFLKKWSSEKLILLFEIIDNKTKSEILYNLNSKHITFIIQNLSLNELKDVFDKLYVDEIVQILTNQPNSIKNKIYSILPKKLVDKVKSYSKYPQNTAGYNMTIDYIKVYENSSVLNALQSIKNQFSSNDSEIVGAIFVVNKQNVLQGMVRPEELISSMSEIKVKEIMEETPSVKVYDKLESVKKDVEKYEQSFLPVVDKNSFLVGVIGAEDIMDKIITISEKDVSEGVVNKISKPYSQQSAIDLFKARIFWIVLLLIIGTFTQIMIIGFQLIWQNAGLWNYNDGTSLLAETSVSSIITLGFATSLSVASSINDASGNSGAQSSTTLIRALATNDVDVSMTKKILLKEFNAGILIGLVISVTAFFRMWTVWGIMGQYGDITSWFVFGWYIVISLIASVSFASAIIIGNLVGALLPLMAAKLNKDGALFSGPLQTTVVDIITFLIYLSLTTIVFVLSADYINSHDTTTKETLNVIFQYAKTSLII